MIKTRNITIAFAVTLMAICTSFLQASAGERFGLRVMSMNIKEGALYADHKVEPFAELINEYAPDVVCLQEVDHFTKRNGKTDFLNALAQATGMFPYWCKSFTYQGGGFGVALLSKYPFLKAEKIISTIAGSREPRSAGWIYVRLPQGGTVRVATTHLALESSEITIRNFVDVNKKIFEQDKLTPTLLIGDYNAEEDSDPIRYVKNTWQEIGEGTGFTIPSDNPKVKLDYIMGYPKKWNYENYKIIARPDMSDHCFVMADLIYEGN